MHQELAQPETCPFTWLDITNPTPDELNDVAKQYGLYETVVKDCLEPDHLPKFEVIGTVSFLITRIYDPKENKEADTIQDLSSKIAIFYSTDFLITVHRKSQPVLEDIRHRFIDTGHCKSTADLAIRIVRWVLNSYVDPGLKLANDLDEHESTIFLRKKSPHVLQSLYYLKRKASSAKRILTLSEDILACLRRIEGNSPLLQDTQDLHVKATTIYDQVQDSVTHLLNIYLSLSSQRTNEVMRVLTIFSAFFLPLTFIAGIYGMNFKYMPELDWKAGYPAVLIFMVAVAAGIYLWFKRKGWI
ncbi:magnesium/cobalt transporter CorA [Larkinella knui]|uniref:Magnesium transporter CorA n=1 Tax=Larkinella knui TaxID=2025310 RepID=A0A3P1CR81_9BACT|nr:Loki-CTERM sorting domain-containing protein [Larkinella knui]RRB15474.1 magnesium transporter CorA [Larkinella knui]